MNEITIPKKLQPIVEAFFADSPETAKTLIEQAAKAIYGLDDDDPFTGYGRRDISSEELETVCFLMQSLNPKDTLEALFASQIVVTHMIGMKKLSQARAVDQYLGLKLLRFSSDAMVQLHKKRAGGLQNITVNYNYSGKAAKQPQLEEVKYAD